MRAALLLERAQLSGVRITHHVALRLADNSTHTAVANEVLKESFTHPRFSNS